MEKPIIFSTEMVKAILADRKTKTRRLNGLKEINENPDEWDLQSFEVDPELMAWDKNGDCYPRVKKGLIATFENNELGEVYRNIKCPWEVGDILWVRETWNQTLNTETDELGYVYKEQMLRENVIYTDLDDDPIKWQPSIFMPRTAARLFLKVKDIRVERLQDITEEDAIAEGILWNRARKINELEKSNNIIDNAKALFMRLWDSINSKRGYGWDLNPWVWVVEFERVEV